MNTSILRALIICGIGLCAVAYCAARPFRGHKTSKTYNGPSTTSSLKLESAAFKQDGHIPLRYTCDDEDISPELHWSGAPKETVSYVLIMDDPDAKPTTWVHWIVFNIPAEVTSLQMNFGNESKKLEAQRSIKVRFGATSADAIDYHGACPPSGTHHYHFKLYALNAVLNLPEGVSKEKLLKAIEHNIIAQTELVGIYARNRR